MKRSIRRFSTLGVLVLFAMSLVAFVLYAPTALAQDVNPAVEAPPDQPVDLTPPVILMLPDVIFEAVDGGGAVVTYPAPTANDAIDGAVAADCAPASGSLLPLGTTAIRCSATDTAGNRTEAVALNVLVLDRTAPILDQPGDIEVVATDGSGAMVAFNAPNAFDSVNGAIASSCSPSSGSLFAVGTHTVRCSAADAAGNAASVSFLITVAPAPIPETPIVETPTEEPVATETPIAQETPDASPTPGQTPEATPTPQALALPWPPPPPINPIYGSGPIDGLSLIWGGLGFPVSQEYGHTLFSLSQPTLYLYGTDLGLDGRAHPGLDIGMGRGNYLYSPVDGTVVAAGGTGGFGFYGNTLPGVGELRIEDASGNQVILGHMAAISVSVGDQVALGQFVGLSGGENGDHLHLETREAVGGGYIAVDPRQSFLIQSLAAYNAEPEAGSLTDDAEAASSEEADESGIEADGDSAGLGDGSSDATISAPEQVAKKEDEESNATATDVLGAFLNPPSAPVVDAKRSAAEGIFRRSGN